MDEVFSILTRLVRSCAIWCWRFERLYSSAQNMQDSPLKLVAWKDWRLLFQNVNKSI